MTPDPTTNSEDALALVHEEITQRRRKIDELRRELGNEKAALDALETVYFKLTGQPPPSSKLGRRRGGKVGRRREAMIRCLRERGPMTPADLHVAVQAAIGESDAGARVQIQDQLRAGKDLFRSLGEGKWTLVEATSNSTLVAGGQVGSRAGGQGPTMQNMARAINARMAAIQTPPPVEAEASEDGPGLVVDDTPF